MELGVSIGRLLSYCASLHGHRTAIVEGDKRTTYRQINERANQVAHGLSALGLVKGEKVGVLFENCSKFVEAAMGAMKIGGVAVLINWRLTPSEVSYQIEQSEVSILIYRDQFAELMDTIRPRLGKVRAFVCAGKAPDGVAGYDSAFGAQPTSDPAVEVESRDVAAIIYTSGTTGYPKGVVTTHGYHLWNALSMTAILGRRTEESELLSVSLQGMPFFRLYLANLVTGSTVVFPVSTEALELVKVMERERIAYGFFPLPLLVRMLEIPDLSSFDLKTFRKAIVGGQLVSIELKRRIREKFPGLALYDVYGATEGGPLTALLPEDAFRGHGCIGKPYGLAQVRIVDEGGREVSTGEIGEIVAAGPMLMDEYYRNREATDEALAGGWLHTGDLARFDSDGYIFIVGRKKDMIRTGGYNVYAAEVERVLLAIPQVLEAAVFGVPDPVWGESVNAALVPKQGQELGTEEVLAICREKLASYKLPRAVHFTADLPKNLAGKVIKEQLKQRYGGPS